MTSTAAVLLEQGTIRADADEAATGAAISEMAADVQDVEMTQNTEAAQNVGGVQEVEAAQDVGGVQEVEAAQNNEAAQDIEDVRIVIDETNFPDDAFRSYVLTYIDKTEPKNALTADEIAAVKSIYCEDKAVKTLKGIEFFTNLENLYCPGNLFTELDFSNNTKLKELSVAQCSDLASLNVSGCSALVRLTCSSCTNLSSLNVTGCSALEFITCYGCKMLTGVDLSTCVALLNMNFCCCYNLTGVDVSSCPELIYLYCEDCNALTSVNVGGCSKLQYIDCDRCLLKSLDVSTCTSLVNIDIDYCGLTELVLGSHPDLVQVSCMENDITYLDLSKCPKLEHLWCGENNISVLKVNRNPLLKTLQCDGNPVSRIEIYSSPYLLKLIETDLNPGTGEYQHHLGYTVEYLCYRADVKVDGWSYSCRMDIDASDVLVVEAPVYSVSVTTDGNGTASASVTSGTEYTEGTLSAVANEGYVFKTWQVVSGNVVIGDLASAMTAFAIGDSDVVIKAVFEAIPANPNPGEPQPGDPGDPGNPNPDPVKAPSFEDFIERMYVVALNRQSEPEGKAFWMDKIKNDGFTGGRVAIGFLIEAPEFLNRQLSDSDFVDVLYKTFFDRSADEGGKAFWMGHLATDMTREQVVRGFIDSTEWCNLCAYYGVKSGAPNAKAEKPSANALKFATRLYTECLGREPDADGLLFWALRLTNLESSGYEAAKGFFESDEFVGKNVDDTTYVKLLYRTFMGRDYDQGGLEFWLGHLSTDMTRLQVLQGFAQSQEFTNICNEYGIDRGTI